MTPTITAYMGVIGGGKDHRANILSGSGHVRIDFKDELCAMCSDIAGYDVTLDYSWFKEMPVGVMRPSDPLQEAFLHSEWKEIMRKYPGIITGRKLLTRVGTEAIRKRHPNYWANRFSEKASALLREGRSVVCADCRFFNEVSMIYSLPFSEEFVFADYRSNRYDPKFDHPSERLAQTLLGLGLKDGQAIKATDFKKAAEILGEEF
jgi:hypothetical protein